MNEIELMQLPNGIENFLSELKPATKAKWNYELRKYEIDNSPEAIEKQKAGCELVKSSLRDIYSFGEAIARGTPKFCLALKRIFDNLRYVEDDKNECYPYGSDSGIRGSMSDYSRSGENFTKLIGELGLSSTAGYRYKDLANFVDEKTGEWLKEFKGYSISLISEIWLYAVESYNTYPRDLKDLAKIIPANTTIADMRLYRKVRKLEKKFKAPFEKYEDRKEITDKTPLPKVLKIYNKLIQKAEAEQQKQEPAEELKPITEYPGQLPGQTAMTLEEVKPEPEEVIPDVGNDIEEKNTISEERSEFGYPGTMTNDELIEYCLKYDVHQTLKFEIIRFYKTREPGMSQFKEFVKSNYLSYGHNGAGFKFGYCKADDDSLTVLRSNGSKIVLSWGPIAGRIQKLIVSEDYLDEWELNGYLQWKARLDDEAEQAPEGMPDEESAEPDEDFSERSEKSVIDIEPEPRQLTNREWLATLRDDEFAEELCLKIIRIFPMGGKSSQFKSTVQNKLTDWLQESVDKEISEMIKYLDEANDE